MISDLKIQLAHITPNIIAENFISEIGYGAKSNFTHHSGDRTRIEPGII